MYRKISSKGLANMILFFIVVVFLMISIFLFTWFFKYHINLYIFSDSSKSKGSLIPFVLLTSTYDEESFSQTLTKVINKISDESPFKNKVIGIVEYYLKGEKGYIMCYRLEIGDLKVEKMVVRVGHGEKMCGEQIFRKIYPVPVVFDGSELTKELDFATFKVGG